MIQHKGTTIGGISNINGSLLIGNNVATNVSAENLSSSTLIGNNIAQNASKIENTIAIGTNINGASTSPEVKDAIQDAIVIGVDAKASVPYVGIKCRRLA